jgi:hypothetical protein
MKKILSIVLILISSTFIGISSANAVTQCPPTAKVSDLDPTKCISLTASYSPVDKTSISSCPDGSTLNTSNMCVTPGVYVPAGTYAGEPDYRFFCSGNASSTPGYCYTTLNPPIVNYVWSPPNDCSGSYYSYGGLCHSVSNFNITKPYDVYPACSSGVREGSNCVTTVTEILSPATRVIDGYFCNGVKVYTDYCTTPGYTTADTLSDPVISYSGTCVIYTTINKTTGMCVPYTFDPSEPIQQTIYKCIVTGWGNTPETVYYNYDSTVIAPFGKSITCSPVTTSVQSETVDGIYYCNSTNLVTGNTFYYASDVDATGATSIVITTCEFSVNEYLNNFEIDQIPVTELDTTCDNIYTYEFLLQCLASKYV